MPNGLSLEASPQKLALIAAGGPVDSTDILMLQSVAPRKVENPYAGVEVKPTVYEGTAGAPDAPIVRMVSNGS